MLTYYERTDYLSNSHLSDLQKQMNAIEDPDNLQDIYDFGNLVGSKITGVASVIESEQKKEDLEKAEAMQLAFMEDTELKKMCSFKKPEYAFYRERFRVNYDGQEIILKVKCKWDLWDKGLPIEIKTTAVKNAKAFRDAIDFFDWDRAAALYMDLSNVDRMLIAAVSKHVDPRTGKHPVFKHGITRDSNDYKRGKAKYNRLIHKWDLLVSSLNIQL